MSSEKGDVGKFTKVEIDENTDSGFLSGPISEQLTSKEDSDVDESVKKKEEVICVQEDSLELDSGLDLSECLSSVKISESSVQTVVSKHKRPAITVSEDVNTKLLPWAKLFEQDEDGDTQLHIAAVHGCERSVGVLLRACPDRAWLDCVNEYRQTALHLSVAAGHAVVARMLVLAGAALGPRDLRGETALHVAAARGDLPCLHALLAPTHNHARRLAHLLNQKNFNGQTCVHLAAAGGHLETLHSLVFYGADVNAREGLCGRSALHIAGAGGHVAMCEYLLERCSGVDRRLRDYGGRTPRRTAAHSARHLFAPADDSDTDSDTDDEIFEAEVSLFDRLRDGMTAINVN